MRLDTTGSIVVEVAIVLCGSLAGAVLAQALRRHRRETGLVDPRRIPSLLARSPDQREALLRESQREAFRGWRIGIPALAVALAMTLGATAAVVARAYSLPPDSAWFRALLAGAIAGLGAFPARLAITAYVRRYVERRIRIGEPPSNPPLQPASLPVSKP